MRKMATIRKIDDIRPIVGADAIECAVVGGWTVVVKKGEYKVGDLAVYCEIDSWIPHEVAPFLSKGDSPSVFNDVRGERLRTVKLRGQLSQGLLLPLSIFPHSLGFDYATDRTVGEDVSEWLKIQKYEPPVPAQLAGEVRGVFPGFIPKTDQERCLSGETLVDTDRGKLAIESIVSAKMAVNVYSYNHETHSIELKPITDWSVMTRKNTWLKIKMKSGKELICTKNHRIWCEDISAYRQADQIEIGQKIIVKTL